MSMVEEDNRIPIFVGAFLFGMSILVVLIGMFFLGGFDDTLPEKNYLEISFGWVGAVVFAGAIAFKMYSDKTQGLGGSSVMGDEGDSAISFVTGLSVALYALLAAWLYFSDTPELVLAFGLGGAAMAFVGIIVIVWAWSPDSF